LKLFYWGFLLFICSSHLFAQVELVPISNKVYPFLNSLFIRNIITNYNSANLPLSRSSIADYLNKLNDSNPNLSVAEKKILNDLKIEFDYDINKKLTQSVPLLSDFNIENIFKDDSYKFLYSYADSNASLFLDGTVLVSQRIFDSESFNKTSITIGEYGFRLRGTLYHNIGFYLKASSGQQFNGDYYSRTVAAEFDPKLHSTLKFLSEKYLDSFEGYLRFETSNRAFALTMGREAMTLGTGYIDKLFLSTNAVPFDYAKIDLGYKGIKYSYFYGNIRGDSLGVVLESKNIIAQRLDISLSEKIRLGVFESVITANRPISFTYLNPVSFLFSADLTAEKENRSNAMIGLDIEILPFKNVGFQSSLLIDDFDFKLIGKDTPASNNNRFGWQFGIFYSNPLGIKDLNASLEYTHLDPFLYSHKSNMSQYTNWSLPLGHKLRPNSDEIALKLDYYFTSRIISTLTIQHQRTGEGFVYDQNGVLIRNYGADINHGEGLYLAKAYFLDGNRVDQTIITFHTRFEPIRQYFLDVTYTGWLINDKYISKNYFDQFFYLTISTDF